MFIDERICEFNDKNEYEAYKEQGAVIESW